VVAGEDASWVILGGHGGFHRAETGMSKIAAANGMHERTIDIIELLT